MIQRLLSAISLVLLLAVATPVGDLQAAAPQTVGEGFLSPSSGAGGLGFSLAADDPERPYFELWDYSSDPPRDLALVELSETKCLGDMFGGQTVRLTGAAVDNTEPGSALRIQVFLVDGGDSGPDRLSVKVQRADGKVTFFSPMRDLDSGDVQVSCPG